MRLWLLYELEHDNSVEEQDKSARGARVEDTREGDNYPIYLRLDQMKLRQTLKNQLLCKCFKPKHIDRNFTFHGGGRPSALLGRCPPECDRGQSWVAQQTYILHRFNIATGEISQAITLFRFLDYFKFSLAFIIKQLLRQLGTLLPLAAGPYSPTQELSIFWDERPNCYTITGVGVGGGWKVVTFFCNGFDQIVQHNMLNIWNQDALVRFPNPLDSV